LHGPLKKEKRCFFLFVDKNQIRTSKLHRQIFQSAKADEKHLRTFKNWPEITSAPAAQQQSANGRRLNPSWFDLELLLACSILATKKYLRVRRFSHLFFFPGASCVRAHISATASALYCLLISF
jgi:hypothetical protein